MGQKSRKGEISISNAQGRIRLRWRVDGERFSLNLPYAYTEDNLQLAEIKAIEIKLDILTGKFDRTLTKYIKKQKGGNLSDWNGPGKQKLFANEETIDEDEIPHLGEFLDLFNYWVKNIRSIIQENSNYYQDVRDLIIKWKGSSVEELPLKFNSPNWAASTFNSRLECMTAFLNWLVLKKMIPYNSLSEVRRRKRTRDLSGKRRPLEEHELVAFLSAIKNDTYCPKSSAYKHSYYFPFFLFLTLTGVRNAEAIGLRIKHLNFKSRKIEISETMARTLEGTHHTARKRKGTKRENIRFLPMSDSLYEVLKIQTIGRKPDDFVFPSPKGLSIDDRMLLRRVFRPVIQKLGIPDRVLYFFRHNFGTKSIEQGISPTSTAYSMGHGTVETVMRNYVSVVTPATTLPNIIPDGVIGTGFNKEKKE